MVDSQGTKEPVRVTYSDGFDGLPVPSPDGRQLAWTSSRSGGAAGQLFLAQWNHEKALEAIRNAPPRKPAQTVMRTTNDRIAPLSCCSSRWRSRCRWRASRARRRQPRRSRTKEHVVTLASDAARRAAHRLRRRAAGGRLSRHRAQGIGAKPIPGRTGLPAPVRVHGRDAGRRIPRHRGVRLPPGPSGAAATCRRSPSRTTARSAARVVFAGYGIVVPESQDFGYDSYATLT